MRSFVTEPMSYGTLHLAGDAAHIVPPTGAKGLNLAVADVQVLATAIVERFTSGRMEALERYSSTSLERVWAAEHFSWWMTSLLHRFPDGDPFAHRLQVAELRKVMKSTALQTVLAEQYVGAPMPGMSGQAALPHDAANRSITSRQRRIAEQVAQWTPIEGKT